MGKRKDVISNTLLEILVSWNQLSILKKKNKNKESHKTIEFQQNSLSWTDL